MTADEFKALRAQSGLSQGGLADKLGVTRQTINRWESSAQPVAPHVTADLMLDVTAEANVTPEPVTLAERKRSNVTRALDLSKLTPWTVPPGLEKRTLPIMPGWQVCGHRVVHGSIPEPIPYEAPSWAGWRAILSRSGRVYDYETGIRIMPFGTTPRPEGPTPGSRQQLTKKYRSAA